VRDKPSDYLKKMAIGWGASENKIKKIHNAVQLPFDICSVEKPLGERWIVSVGRLVPWKGVEGIMRAVKELSLPDIRLKVVGDGPERENLPKHSRVIFEGTQKEPSRFYQNADAFLLTSNSEGWGVVVTEAAGFGLPIIMTDVGCAGEFIKNGENGIVIPIGDEDALVAAMRRIIENAELRARLGRSARASFSALPSAEEQIRKQVEEWHSIVTITQLL